MKTITFLRVRPAEAINEIFATTRRKGGTTALEVRDPRPQDIAGALAGGVLPISGDPAQAAVAWAVSTTGAMELLEKKVAGWRITVEAGDSREDLLDAVVRSGAAFVRTSRARVAEHAGVCDLPAVDAAVSVFVDTVADAVAALESGAADLLLRDWGTERVADLREAMHAIGVAIVERTALPVGLDIDNVRTELTSDMFEAYLSQTDGSGAVRPRYTWAPGKAELPPLPVQRFSAEFTDDAWMSAPSAQLADASPAVAEILERSLGGTAPTVQEIEVLFRARGGDVDAVAAVADQLRRRSVGDTVTYVINRNINYTNQCYFRCGFCAFSKGPRSLNLRGAPYLMDVGEIVERASEAWSLGATEVCLQGGIHPEFTGDFYVNVVESIKAQLPEIHIHGFTPLEVWQGAETLGVPVKDFLTRLRDAGLGTLPGTAAEILDDDVREYLCPDKIRTAQWAEVMITAHELGMKSTSTIMFGHIDSPRSWARHLEVLRAIQRRTGGITELVPLPFVHMGAPIFLQGRSRPGPTWDEVVLVHAVGRIALDGLIPNIQASWVKLGLEGGGKLLNAGCNDLGGTLMNEIISRSAGASHGQEASPDDFERLVALEGRSVARRNTVYDILETAT